MAVKVRNKQHTTTIKKGHHRGWPLRLNIIRLETSHHYSGIFHLKGIEHAKENQSNKIFGQSFSLNHHKDSFRVCWEYTETPGVYSLVAYYYNYSKLFFKGTYNKKSGARVEHILFFEKGDSIEYNVYYDYLEGLIRTNFNINGARELYEFNTQFIFDNEYGYELFPYHGGQEPSQHTYTVYNRYRCTKL